ncbi:MULTISPECIES: methylated-DNA--[protein]-cysteine S-methyltransferase [Thalassospira]|uniref:Cysteine methyltransferase n=2 Tax=Thalassospira TaxID=168934 RepID=A0A367W4A9_9PROT|nr:MULTISPECIES: methylated-DNA--[protein]-cysteine S-methyltransferase [Thalassospira]MDG4721312.1 methylated-DNA--[protein]-cysteine S-methyltransferase [Thalassospira sp. FZY0004]RCK33591.1 cysteine methyltransferase [Thalassospira profundimaris]
MTTTINVVRYASPIGMLSLSSVDGKLVHLDFEDNDDRLKTIQTRRFKKLDWIEGGSAPKAITNWLDGYFAGVVGDLPMAAITMIGTDFQKSVWDALINIPNGKSVSYAGLAVQLGKPNAVRAVARANALNPVSIIVPCHRVIGSNGTLTGYAGGLDRKKWLLDHEAAMLARAA